MNSKLNMLEIWLTHADQQDAAIQGKLQSIYDKYATPKRRVAVFYSGSNDLVDVTKELLTNNLI